MLEAHFRFTLTDSISLLSVSDEVEALLGFKPDDFLAGRVSLKNLIHVHDLDIASELFSTESNKTSGTFNIRLRQANGRIRCIKGHYSKALVHPGSSTLLGLCLQDAKSLWQGLGDQPIMVNFNAMMENTDDYIYFKDRNHVFNGASQTLVAITEPSKHWTDLLGLTDYDVFPEEYADIYYRLEKQVFAGIPVAQEIQATLDNNGNKGWVDNRKYPIKNKDGEIIGLFGIARDITDHKNVEQQLQLTQYATDHAPYSILWVDEQARIRYVNEAVCKEHGFTKEELLKMSIPDFDPEFPAEAWPAHWQELKQKGNLNFETRHTREDGSIYSIEVSANYVKFGDLELNVAYNKDITERKQTELELQIAATAFDSQESMIITDGKGVILRVNKAFTESTGYKTEELVGQTPRLLKSGRHDSAFYKEMWNTLVSKGLWQGEIWDRRKNGEIYPKWLSITAVKANDGMVTNYVGAHFDITERKLSEEKIRRLAFHDSLTNLPNRQLLLDRLRQTLATVSRSNRKGALLFIDLDNFKSLNDTLGHAMGDMLLKQVAHRLVACVREGDTVSRLGGDEFVVVLQDLSEKEAEAVEQAEGIGGKILAALNQPFELENGKHSHSGSIGIILFSGQHQDPEELLKQADIAMYQSKTAGRNTLRFFDPRMQEAINIRVALESELRKAMECQQFKLHYQIQVDKLNRPIGAEALIRWMHPERGMVSPAQFIPLAEETGLILPIGNWVLDTACAQISAWQQDNLMLNLTLAVNVSSKQFRQVDFASQVEASIQRHGIIPRLLKLELTESLLLEDVSGTVATMQALKEIGVQFSLDDFGTGYSSLQYLKKLPLNQIKIDQSFVRDIVSDQNDAAIVQTIIAMAAILGFEVIAEGVETQAQRDFLELRGCNAYQGYLFSKPMLIDQFEALIRRR
jgi:diguanylate cyclase (GGDEF)-like protein/PAS domain S-box-containing protein